MFNKNNKSKTKVPRHIDTTKYYRYVENFEFLSQKNYKVLKQLGRGGYGIVYKAQDLENQGLMCAIKIHFHTILRQQAYIQILILTLASDKSRIAHCQKTIIEQQQKVYHIVLDYYPNYPYIRFFNSIDITEAGHYIYQLLLALKDLKSLGIYHRDVKPGNFLYNRETKKGRLIDFGLAQIDRNYVRKLEAQIRQLQEDNDPKALQLQEVYNRYLTILQLLGKVGQQKMGTQSYMPLESILKLKSQSYASDIWPVGVIFLQMVTRRYCIFPYVDFPIQGVYDYKTKSLINFLFQLATLFGKKNVIDQLDRFQFSTCFPQALQQIDLRQVCIIQDFTDDAFNLVTRLLDINPQTRITVEDALEHAFFDGIRDFHPYPDY